MPRRVKSIYVGRALDGTTAVTTAYRAVVALKCVACKGTIDPDHLFSRRSQPTSTNHDRRTDNGACLPRAPSSAPAEPEIETLPGF